VVLEGGQMYEMIYFNDVRFLFGFNARQFRAKNESNPGLIINLTEK
jgi:hypothetical protein